MDLFRVRLNCIDHYQISLTRYDPQLRNDVRPSQASKGPKVPVVRIFGSTETGQKVCAHVHGAFPYLYVEYPGGAASEEGSFHSLPSESMACLTLPAVGAFIYRLHLSIDHALAVSYRRDQHGGNAKFVARITLVKGVPFYGFHVGYRLFLKIYMFNPMVMTRLADLLQQGVIMKRQFQPFEAHLQYLLQFMVDYNLYGCDYLEASKTAFRSPIPQQDQGSNSSHLWHSLSIPQGSITDDPSLPRASHCSIEVDICVQNITNRKAVRERRLHHDFVERHSPIAGDVKLVHSMAGLWRDETKRRKRQLPRMQQGKSPFPPDVLVTMSADPRDSQPQGWIHEEEYRDDIRNLVDREQADLGDEEVGFDTFARSTGIEEGVNTALQSVEDLYPSKLMPALGLPSNPSQSSHGVSSSIEVDETKARQVQQADDEFFPDDSDQEALAELVVGEGFDETWRRTTDTTGQPEPAKDAQGTLGGACGPQSCLKIQGICRSMLKTKRLPTMPVSAALLEAAEDEGLVGRVKPTDDMRCSTRDQPKRRRSSASTPSSSWKRPKKELHSSGARDSAADGPNVKQPGNRQSEPRSRHEPKPNLAKSRDHYSSGAATLNQTLSFAIVKDHLDASNQLHLSQKSQLSSSQWSDEADYSKQMSHRRNALVAGSQHSISISSLLTSDHSASPNQGSRTRHGPATFSSRPTLVFAIPPPSKAECSSMKEHNLLDVIYQDAFYGEEKDVPDRNREYAGREYRLDSNTVPFLPQFDVTGSSPPGVGHKQDAAVKRAELEEAQAQQRRECSWRSWEFAQLPPSRQSVIAWHDERSEASSKKVKESHEAVARPAAWLSQICGPTPKNKHGFKYTQKRKSTSVEHEVQYMSTMSLELHVNTRGKFVPNPEEDEIQCVFWGCKSDEKAPDTQESTNALQSGIIALSGEDSTMRKMPQCTRAEVVQESSELDVLTRVVEVVRTFDPDVLTGFEVHSGSWGYLIERARCKYDYDLCDDLSRMKSDSHGRFGKKTDRWGFNTTSTIRITGRHMINIWRAMQNELNLLQYTMENVAWHLLHIRVPHYSWKTLTQWYKSGKARDLSKLLRYYRTRTRLDIRILEANELIPRTSEQARLLGVDFFSVFSRGSQFKVESIMFRIAKPENFLLVSPSKKQVGGQNALECLPLVMEPQSAFYNSPLLVLDFQSLYPSVMIAYNYCYSTFMGRIKNWRGTSKMGFSEYSRQRGLLLLLQDYINIAPNGMMYVKAEIRKSLLAKMLTEILETSHDQERHEEGQARQDAAAAVEQPPTGAEALGQRHVRLHIGVVFRPYALLRDRRQHRADGARDAGTGRCVHPLGAALGRRGGVRRHGQPLCPPEGPDARAGVRARRRNGQGDYRDEPAADQAQVRKGLPPLRAAGQEAVRRVQVRAQGAGKSRV